MKRYLSIVLVLFVVILSSTIANAATPVSGDKWNKTSLKVYVNDNIKTNYSTSIYNALSNGVTAYNGTYAPTASVSSSYIYTWDIIVDMSNWGYTGWTGLASGGGGGVFTIVQIDVNSYGMSSYYGDSGLWKAIACHEMGHALGLAHNTSDTYSIMKPGVNGNSGFYDYSGGGSGLFLTTPQTVDKTAIGNIY